MSHFHDEYFHIRSICRLENNRKYRSELLPLDGGWFTFGEEVATMNEIFKKSNISLPYFLVI